jgi:hypothetical protein
LITQNKTLPTRTTKVSPALLAYFVELGEIIINMTAAILRGDITEKDAADYLEAAQNEEQS